MLASSALKDLLHLRGLTRQDQLLICLSVDTSTPKSVAEIKSLALGGGLRRIKDWNVSAILGRMNGLAIRTEAGWELTASGRNAAATVLAKHSIAPTAAPANQLRSLLSRVSHSGVREFLAETVACLEFGQLRAAVVLSWVGAVALLQEHVISSHLAAFNAEALRRDAKWRAATASDGLSKIKEFDFLQILEAISVLGKNTKTELEGCLKLRNACGHPNSLSIAEHRIASHIEILLLNVYVPYSH